MTFIFEADDVRQEVRRGYASNPIAYYPKLQGVGRLTVTGTPTFELYSPTGTLLASGSCTVTAVGGADRLDITADASDTTAWTLAENYRGEVTWTYQGVVRKSTFRFDCVLEPVQDALGVGLNDLIDEVADMGERLLRQATAQADGRTAEQQASLLAYKAWGDVKRWIRAKLADQGRIYPRLIIDREAVRLVVAAQAVQRAYAAEGTPPGADSHALAEEWGENARVRFVGLGELAYDSSEDGVADTKLRSFGTTQAERSWS